MWVDLKVMLGNHIEGICASRRKNVGDMIKCNGNYRDTWGLRRNSVSQDPEP